MLRQRWARTWSTLERLWPDAVIIACLLLLSLWVRRLTLWDIEGGGDAIKKWFFVKQWSFDNSLREVGWNHHLTRFGVNLWVFVVQKVWGTDATAYYVAPVAVASLGAVFTYQLARELAGRAAGVLAAIWFITLEPMERAGSQLLAEGFSATYVAGAMVFLLWYLRSRGPTRVRRLLLAASALWLFLAYLAKEPNLLFVPGFLLAAAWDPENRRDAWLFAGILLSGFLLESAWYVLFTDYSTRLEIVTSTHHGGTLKHVTRTLARHGPPGAARHAVDWVLVFWKLLERYQVLWDSIKLPLFTFLAASLSLWGFLKQRAVRAVSVVVLVYLVLMTFSIRQVAPVKVWMSNEPRYFIVLCPLLIAVNAAFIAELTRRAWAARPWKPRLRLGIPRSLASVGLASLVCVWIGVHYYVREGKRAFGRGSPLGVVAAHQQAFSDAYARGLPILQARSKDQKALRLIYSVYLDERLLAQGGQLPSFEAAVRSGDPRFDWLERPGPTGLRARLVFDRKCSYFTGIRGRFLSLRPPGNLPSACAKSGRRG